MRNRNVLISLLFLLSVFALVGCSRNQSSKKKGVAYKMYYCNSEETELVEVPHYSEQKDQEKLIKELIDSLSSEPKSLKYKKVKPDVIELLSFSLNEDGQLTLHFSSDYSELSGIPEILLRAAIVKMLCQFDNINCVEIYVEDQPLMRTGDKPYGFETAEDFIDNTGRETNFSQNVTMGLYFATESGKRLKEVSVDVTYDGTISLEQLIVQRLIDGPETIGKIEKEAVQATVPKGTVVQKTMVREGACYVYVNKAFKSKLPDITDDVAIYSVVNSLCELSTVNKVQFIVDGTVMQSSQKNEKTDGFFERNLDIVVK